MDASTNREVSRTSDTPSQVRARILGEHALLRRQLVQVQILARSCALESDQLPALQRELRQLLVDFARHLDSEESVLVPAIECVDAWGPARVERLLHEHSAQRALLRRMYDQARGLDATRLAELADDFVLRTFRDMHEEEDELLTEAILHDDLVIGDQFGG